MSAAFRSTEHKQQLTSSRSSSSTTKIRANNGSVGHRSNGSTNLDGSRGLWVSTRDPLTDD